MMKAKWLHFHIFWFNERNNKIDKQIILEIQYIFISKQTETIEIF